MAYNVFGGTLNLAQSINRHAASFRNEDSLKASGVEN